MGIPHYFGHLARAHPEVLLEGGVAAVASCCDRLFIDFNCVVHQCANDVIAHGVDDVTKTTSAVIRASINHIDVLVAMLRPRYGVYVAVDGVPPRAKMEQQRQRRFMSMITTKSDSAWDRNMITPGTPFMAELTLALASWASIDQNHAVRTVSDAESAGEGEQKIFARLRDTNFGLLGFDCLFGLDADLCMMSLTLPPGAGDRVVILRDAGDGTPMRFVDVKAMRRAIARDIVCDDGAHDYDSIEYVAMCLLLGNDFVPALPGLVIVDGGVDLMARLMSRLRNASVSADFRIVGEDGHLHLGGMHALLGAVAAQEDTMCRAAERRYYDRVRQRQGSTRDDIRLGLHGLRDDHPLRFPYPAKDVIRAGDPGWRASYYRFLFNGMDVGREEDGEVWRVCHDYCAALDWSLRYLGGDCVDAAWHYPYLHAPTAHDLHRFLTTIIQDGGSFHQLLAHDRMPSNVWAAHVPPSLHLLAVLPVSSAALLRPVALGRVHIDKHLGCVHMFPTNFALRTYLHTHLWQCQPLLPAMDMSMLRAAHDRIVRGRGGD